MFAIPFRMNSQDQQMDWIDQLELDEREPPLKCVDLLCVNTISEGC